MSIIRVKNILSKINPTHWFWFRAILYKLLLEIYFCSTISKLYSSEGLVFELNLFKYVLSWLGYLFLFYLMPKNKEELKSIFLHLQFGITFGPVSVLFSLSDRSLIYFLMVLITLALETMMLRKEYKKIGTKINVPKKLISVFFFLLILFVYFEILNQNGFHGLKSFNLKYLYEMRGNIQYSFPISYLVNWIPTVILPFFFLYNLNKNKPIFSFCILLVMTLFYMSMGNKFIYLSIIVMITVYFFTKRGLLLKIFYSGMTMMLLVLSCLNVAGISTHSLSISNALVGERFLFIPAYLKFSYYDCFSELPKSYFADGFIGKSFGINNLYKESMGKIVYSYMNKDYSFEIEGNTGYLGDSYGQAGFLGMILIGLLLSLFIILIDNLTVNWSNCMLFPLIALLVILLNDSAFFSIFMTAGWAILLILLLIYSDTDKKVVYRGNL